MTAQRQTAAESHRQTFHRFPIHWVHTQEN